VCTGFVQPRWLFDKLGLALTWTAPYSCERHLVITLHAVELTSTWVGNYPPETHWSSLVSRRSPDLNKTPGREYGPAAYECSGTSAEKAESTGIEHLSMSKALVSGPEKPLVSSRGILSEDVPLKQLT